MASLKIYNSLTRKKEVFESITPGHVGMYVCGPTVSGESHLGHARPYITFDVVNRYLAHLGYKVRYVRNITDAGHFEEEGREAEDKISKKALLERLEPMELVQKYTNKFHWAMEMFNTLEPSIEPTATGHIVEQIVMIEDIIAKGYAYVANGSVYFDVAKYHADFSPKNLPYGILSGRNLDDQLDTTRELENQDEKRDRQDFALWKKAPPEHIMRWPSPWGEGFPGWHIECSAMSNKYLGHRFDIHGGGMDLQFPHHECEIAQSAVCNGGMMAKYWIHNNMITINGKKMGKSYGNQIMLSEMFSGANPILEQAYHPMTVRFFVLQSHYRGTLDFGNEALKASEKALKRLWEAYRTLMKLDISGAGVKAVEITGDGGEPLSVKVKKLLDGFDESMDDDLNTAKVLANMFELVPVINGAKDRHIPVTALSRPDWESFQQKMKVYIEDILALKWPGETEAEGSKLESTIALLIELRKEAKANKDYVTGDKIRKGLEAAGIRLKDEKDGTVTYHF